MSVTVTKRQVPPSAGGWVAEYRCGDCGSVTRWVGPAEPPDAPPPTCACAGDPMWHCTKCNERLGGRVTDWAYRLCNACAPEHDCGKMPDTVTLSWRMRTTNPIAIEWFLEIDVGGEYDHDVDGIAFCPFCGERLEGIADGSGTPGVE